VGGGGDRHESCSFCWSSICHVQGFITDNGQYIGNNNMIMDPPEGEDLYDRYKEH